jgi:hypothetical protein
MLQVIVLLILFVVTTLYGGYSALTSIRKIRRARTYAGALFYWSEHPGAAGRNNLADSLAINIHRLALVIIGLLGALNVLLRGQISFFPLDPSAFWGILAGFLVYCAMAVIGTLFGLGLFGPFAEAMGGDHHYALSNGGLLIAGQMIPWRAFSHFSFSQDGTAIGIWSASLPGSAGMITVPTLPGDLRQLSDLLRSYLPFSDGYSPGTFRRFALPAVMAALSLPFVACAGLLFLAPVGVALVGQCLLMWALAILGGSVIMRLIYGGKAQPAPVEGITGSQV